MNTKDSHTTSPGILYSCYQTRSREGEHFVPEHTLSFQIAGSLTLSDGLQEYISGEGAFRLVRRNQLLKIFKQPPEGGEFRSVSIYLDQKTLRDFSLAYRTSVHPAGNPPKVVTLTKNKALEAYIDSLVTYEGTGYLKNETLVRMKVNECILLLLESNPAIGDILFDFTEPHKIDLEAFMNEHYHFNVRLDRFAYLSGRSLAAFKRDFGQLFHTSPGKWLQQKRLQQAHYLLSKEGKTASDIYLDLGFEDLTHFSHAFKKTYGYSPRNIPAGLSR